MQQQQKYIVLSQASERTIELSPQGSSEFILFIKNTFSFNASNELFAFSKF